MDAAQTSISFGNEGDHVVSRARYRERLRLAPSGAQDGVTPGSWPRSCRWRLTGPRRGRTWTTSMSPALRAGGTGSSRSTVVSLIVPPAVRYRVHGTGWQRSDGRTRPAFASARQVGMSEGDVWGPETSARSRPRRRRARRDRTPRRPPTPAACSRRTPRFRSGPRVGAPTNRPHPLGSPPGRARHRGRPELHRLGQVIVCLPPGPVRSNPDASSGARRQSRALVRWSRAHHVGVADCEDP